MSNMGSSKYEFEPELLEKDVASKLETAGRFKRELEKAIYTEYRYRDNQPMSNNWKREILVEVCREFIEKIGG